MWLFYYKANKVKKKYSAQIVTLLFFFHLLSSLSVYLNDYLLVKLLLLKQGLLNHPWHKAPFGASQASCSTVTPYNHSCNIVKNCARLDNNKLIYLNVLIILNDRLVKNVYLDASAY